MKTLIIFASKYGGTRVVAGKIAREMDHPQLCELGKDQLPDVNQFDCIIIGSPLYAGSIHKNLAAFIKTHMDTLLHKKLGIFIAGLENSERDTPFTENFPEPLLKHAAAKEMTGGISDPKTLGFFTRILMRMITKTPDYHSTVSEEKIKKFTGVLKANA